MAKLNGKDLIGIITKGRLVKLQKKTVTPTSSAQTIKPDSGYDGMSEVMLNKYVSKLQAKTVVPKINDQTIAPDNGYDGLSFVVVKKAPITSRKTITPSTNSQTIKPNSGDIGLADVVVNGDVNLIESNIKKGVLIFGVTGSFEGSVNKLPSFINKTLVTLTADDLYGLSLIPESCFKEFNSLTDVTIPSSVTEIDSRAFEGCTKLKTVTFAENSQLKLYYRAFANCSVLASITLPEGVISIGQSAFEGCGKLASVVIPGSVTNIGNAAFSRCGLTNIVLQNGLPYIGSQMFMSNNALTSIAIPDSVISIERDAFTNCINLKTVTFGENSQLTSIGNNAFSACHHLSSIVIPSGVTSIGDYALNANRLASVTMLPTTPPTVKLSPFNSQALEAIIVPVGCGDAYKAASIWSNYADKIVEATE